jgi:hypothetical protein
MDYWGLKFFDGKFGMLGKEVGYCLLAIAGNCSSPRLPSVPSTRNVTSPQLNYWGKVAR